MPAISLIVATYRNTTFLAAVLDSIRRQSFRDFEVVVAEDDEAPAMREFLASESARAAFPAQHVSQPHQGFGKTRILNAAVRAARAEFLVFIDEDCVLHRHYLAAYARARRPRTVFFGRRVELDEATTRAFVETRDFSRLTLTRLLRSRSAHAENALYLPLPFALQRRAIGLRGCNWGVHKDDLAQVNGFDEDYQRATAGEDTDVQWRLKRLGLRFVSMKFRAVQYHLHHARSNREEDSEFNFRLMQEKQRADRYYCANGLVK